MVAISCIILAMGFAEAFAITHVIFALPIHGAQIAKWRSRSIARRRRFAAVADADLGHFQTPIFEAIRSTNIALTIASGGVAIAA